MSISKTIQSITCLLFLTAYPAYAGYFSTAQCVEGPCFTKVCRGNGCYNPKIHLRTLIHNLESDGVEVITRGEQIEVIIGVDRIFRSQSNLRVFQHRSITLDAISLLLKVHGFEHILIKAHTDNVGSDRAKLGRSQQQAKTIAAYLWSQGIPLGAITPIGCGDTEPVALNKTLDGSAANRRIEIITVR